MNLEAMNYYAAKEWKLRKLIKKDRIKKLKRNYGVLFLTITASRAVGDIISR